MSGNIFDRGAAPPPYTVHATAPPPEPTAADDIAFLAAVPPEPTAAEDIAFLICRNSASDNAAVAARLAAVPDCVHQQTMGQTLLGVACEHHNLPVVRMLLECGADARLDGAGCRPADYIFASPAMSSKLELHRGKAPPDRMAAIVSLLSKHEQLITTPHAVEQHTPLGHPAHAVMSAHQFCCALRGACCTPEQLDAAVRAYVAQPSRE